MPRVKGFLWVEVVGTSTVRVGEVEKEVKVEVEEEEEVDEEVAVAVVEDIVDEGEGGGVIRLDVADKDGVDDKKCDKSARAEGEGRVGEDAGGRG